ncbi:hypothetical protein IH799_05455 [candidate division KSB1 bacterium]|nr:hypothetical protein [candidate division KSB1 bacterium]
MKRWHRYYKSGRRLLEHAAIETMALPVHPDLTDEEIIYVASKVITFMEKSPSQQAAPSRSA